MKRLALIGLAFLLVGCEKSPIRISLMNPTHATYKNVNDYFFIGAGQSNMSHEILTGIFPHSVNLAQGGSALWMWVPGSTFYGQMVAACRAQSLPCVVLFWQGEAEGADLNLDDWRGNFLGIVRQLRQDLHSPIGVVFTQIGQTTVTPVPNWSAIQQQQASIAHALPMMGMVSAMDMFPDTGDGLHYGQDQYGIMQQRMYQAFEDLD